MKRILLVLTGLCLLAFFLTFETVFKDEMEKWFPRTSGQETAKTASEEVKEVAIQSTNTKKDHTYIMWTTEEILEKFGEPSRKDPSAYGYTWWVYPETSEGYLLIGIELDEVVTVFNSNEKQEKQYEELKDEFNFRERVEVKSSEGTYEFELTSEDLETRPLVKYGENWAQFYFDSHTGFLSSVRVMTDEVLLIQKPYSVSYRGSLPDDLTLSPEMWTQIERGESKQIFELTNVLRQRYQLAQLEWSDDVAQVAYLHSKDMSDNVYFSHTSPAKGELQNRFEQGNISFKMAGENIAAQYVDGLAAVEGWLNSEGHRINLLHDEFSHLGVGVYKKYYTQNFMIPFP